MNVGEKLTHTGVTVDVELVAGPAGALERSLGVDANVLTGSVHRQTLVYIWWD